MSKFKRGDKVNILSKNAGEIKSLDSMLISYYRGKVDLPKSGMVTSFMKHDDRWGSFYTVQIDNYDSKVHKYQQFCFKEYDLQWEGGWKDEWGISEDWFVI